MIVFMYLFFLFGIISIENLVGSAFLVGGFPLWTWLIYAFYILSCLYSFAFIMQKNSRDNMYFQMVVFMTAFFCVLAISLYHHQSMLTILKESHLYVIPICMYAFIWGCKFEYASFWKFVKYIVILTDVISVLFLLGVLGTLTNAAYISTLSRSSTLIDGGLGLVALAIGLYCLFYENDFYTEKESWLFILSGILITVSGQSRARLLTAVLLLSVFFLMSATEKNKNSGKRFSWSVTILLAFMIGTVIMLVLSDQTSSLISQIFDRFTLMGTDNPSLYRVYEREKQMSVFKEHPFFGAGWGAYEEITIKNLYGIKANVDNHNMYTTLLGMGGLILAFAYVIWFAKLIKNIIVRYSSQSIEKLNVLMILAIGALSYSSAGFAKSSMVLAITIVYVNVFHCQNIGVEKGVKSYK